MDGIWCLVHPSTSRALSVDLRGRDTGRPGTHRPRQMEGMGTTGVPDRQAPAVERTRGAHLDRPPDRMTRAPGWWPTAAAAP